MDWAWEAQGIGYSVVAFLVNNGVHFDIVVVLPVGVATSWLILFLADRTKRLQRPLVLLAAILFVIWLVFVNKRWVGTVAWVDSWPILTVGLLAGITVGAGPQLGESRRWREFPVAATGLFSLAAILGLVALFDVYVFRSNGVVLVGSGILPGPASLAGLLVDLPTTVGFVVMLGNLVLYSDQRFVAVLSGSPGLGLAVLAGFFNATEEALNGRSVKHGPLLQQAMGPLTNNRRPEPIEKRVEFAYLTQRQFSKWVIVSAAPIEVEQLSDQRVLDKIAAQTERTGPLRRMVSFAVDNLAPRFLLQAVMEDTRLLVDRIANADILVLAASMDDFADNGANGGEGPTPSPSDLSAPSYVSTFENVCKHLDRNMKKIVVLADAENAVSIYESQRGKADTRFSDRGFREFVAGQLLDLGRDVVVVPVSWTDESTTQVDRLVAGIDELISEIDRKR